MSFEEKKINKKREFLHFISLNRHKVIRSRKTTSNCIGTALYLVGEQNRENYLYGGHEFLLNKLKKAEEPKTGYLVAWKRPDLDEIYHLAVVVQEKPLLLATRNGRGEPFRKRQPFNEVNDLYKGYSPNQAPEIIYFIPSKLQKILKGDKRKK